MLAEKQTRPVFCGKCGASALWDEDNECIRGGWDVLMCTDPCDDGQHVPEEFLDNDPEFAEIDAEMSRIDRFIESINETGSFKESYNIFKMAGFLGE